MSRDSCYLGIEMNDEMYCSLRDKLIAEANAGIETPKPVRGCSHKIKEADKFCSKCGKASWIKSDSPLFTVENFCIQEVDLPTVSYFMVNNHDGAQGVGYDMTDMEDTETLLQFKTRLAEALKKECEFNIAPYQLDFYVEPCSRCN